MPKTKLSSETKSKIQELSTAIKTLKERKPEIKAIIFAHGDPSVGMFGWELEMTIKNLDMKLDIEDPIENGREDLRKDITEFFITWLDYGKVEVSFSDECPDCFKVGCKGKCMNGF